jgi:PTH2 family peptidyl-tRNA hydrolase
MPRVAWTGFGEFEGVSENPSAALAEALADEFFAEGDTCEVLEVSAAAARSAAAGEKYRGADVVVHLGVAVDYDTITLERRAHNEAAFRCPDARGWWPGKEAIRAGGPASRSTSVDVESVAGAVRAAGHAIRISDDPGRFVCNYLYWCALENERCCVFVHVPPLAVVGEAEQRRALAALRGALLEDVASGARATALATSVLDDDDGEASDIYAKLLELGIDGRGARGAVDAGCTSVESAMELIFSQPPPPPPGMDGGAGAGAGGSAPADFFEPALKQVLVVNSDLRMSEGKIAAQCAHAALGAYREASARSAADAARWAGEGETVVVLRADSAFIYDARSKATGARLPHCLVADAGRTEVAPGSETVLGIGPGPADAIDAITGELSLL